MGDYRVKVWRDGDGWSWMLLCEGRILASGHEGEEWVAWRAAVKHEAKAILAEVMAMKGAGS